MSDIDEAEFVIFGGRLSDGSVGYANDNGDLVRLERARTWTYDEAIERAKLLADASNEPLNVAPLLFGIPDADNAEYISPAER